MHVRLDYGRCGLEITLPDDRPVTLVEPVDTRPLVDPAAAVTQAVSRPIGSAPLVELARGKRAAVIVVPDKTRPAQSAVVLPPILAALDAAGVPRDGIEILVATGLHRANTATELAEMLGPRVVGAYRVRNHVARNPDEHVNLGHTTRGTAITIDRGFVSSELRIVTGLIEPHLIAGYSGGRKLVAPGLAGVDTMRNAHGPTMLEGALGPGILAGNPFHEDILEIARRVGVHFMCDVTIDRHRRLTGVFAGDLEAAHIAGTDALERAVRVDIDAPADVVVTCAGGYPLDTTFYQSIKGLTAALNIVRRGGTLILAAAMEEGIGSAEFRALLADTSGNDDFMARITTPNFFRIDQWMVQHLCQVLRKADIVLVSDGVPPAQVPDLLATHAPSVETALDRAYARHGANAHVAVLPHGPYVIPTVRGRKLTLGGAWNDDLQTEQRAASRE